MRTAGHFARMLFAFGTLGLASPALAQESPTAEPPVPPVDSASVTSSTTRLNDVPLAGTALPPAAVSSTPPLEASPARPATDSSLSDRVTELEVAQSLNRAHFSGVFVNRFEALRTRYGIPGEDKQTDSLNTFGSYLGLNIDFDVSPHIKLYTTLAMTKFWQNIGRSEYQGNWQASEGGSFGYSGATPQFDRAYMAYEFSFPLTLAVGRMPTNNGLPQNQLDGLAREGTYPRFAYNAIFDGIAAVIDFSRYLPTGNHLQFRGFYTPNINIDKTTRTRQLTDTYTDANGNPVTVKISSNTLQYALLTELSTERFPGLDSLKLYYMFYQYKDFYNDGTNNTDPPANPYDSATAHMIYLGLEGIGHVGLNLSLSTLLYKDSHQELGGPSVDVALSKAFLVNANYKFESGIPGLVVGGEFIKTDDNFYIDDYTYLNLIPFYSTPNSKGVHAFASVPLGEKLHARAGWYWLHSSPYDYLGVPTPEETDSQSVYIQLRLGF
jgi:hypothetical protein